MPENWIRRQQENEATTRSGDPTLLLIVRASKRPLKPSLQVSERMRRVATSGTGPELQVRSIIQSLGFLYSTRTKTLPGRPDVVLPNHRVAVFVHGCFWHGCHRCYTEPKRNHAWWREKIHANQKRDRRKANQLRMLGYSVIMIWEHDSNELIRKRLSMFLTTGEVTRTR